MEILYCDRCGVQISDRDLREGRTTDSGDGGKLCPGCAEAGPEANAAAGVAASPAPAPVPKRDPQRPAPRGGQGPKRPGGIPLAPALVGFGAAFLVAVAVALVFTQQGETPAGEPGGAATGPAPENAPATHAVPAAAAFPPGAASSRAATPPLAPEASPPASPPAPDGGRAEEPAGPSPDDDFFANLRRESEERLQKSLERARSRASGGAVRAGRAEPYEQGPGPDGLVRIEAEEFSATRGGAAHDWELVERPDGFTGRGAMQALPDSGRPAANNPATDSPRLDYRINFVRTGTHYLWVRMFGVDGSGDSCHAGLDGEALSSLKKITSYTSGRYYWESRRVQSRAKFEVPTPGVHTLNIWMREDGTVVDCVVVTSSKSYKP